MAIPEVTIGGQPYGDAERRRDQELLADGRLQPAARDAARIRLEIAGMKAAAARLPSKPQQNHRED